MLVPDYVLTDKGQILIKESKEYVIGPSHFDFFPKSINGQGLNDV